MEKEEGTEAMDPAHVQKMKKALAMAEDARRRREKRRVNKFSKEYLPELQDKLKEEVAEASAKATRAAEKVRDAKVRDERNDRGDRNFINGAKNAFTLVMKDLRSGKGECVPTFPPSVPPTRCTQELEFRDGSHACASCSGQGIRLHPPSQRNPPFLP